METALRLFELWAISLIQYMHAAARPTTGFARDRLDAPHGSGRIGTMHSGRFAVGAIGAQHSVEAISTFDIFKIGVGPSSSHTMGPWRAAQRFLAACRDRGVFDRIVRVRTDLYGSLAKTGRGHGTDLAVLLGLSGVDPVACDTSRMHEQVEAIRSHGAIALGGSKVVPFQAATDLVFNPRTTLPFHPNGLTFTAFLDDGSTSCGNLLLHRRRLRRAGERTGRRRPRGPPAASDRYRGRPARPLSQREFDDPRSRPAERSGLARPRRSPRRPAPHLGDDATVRLPRLPRRRRPARRPGRRPAGGEDESATCSAAGASRTSGSGWRRCGDPAAAFRTP